MDIVLSGNSPGELWGWIRPLTAMIRERIPDASISLFLFPCQYATGKEAEVARERLGISTVVSPKESMRYLFLGESRERFSFHDPVLIHLGGDLMFASLLGKKLKARTYAYQWGERRWDRGIRGYFVSHERQKETLIKRKIPESKIRVTGDLVMDGINLELDAPGNGAAKGRGLSVGLLPGSRAVELLHMLPHYLRIAEVVKEKLPEAEFHLVLSPFVEDAEVADVIDSGRPRELESSSGVLVENGSEKFIETERGLRVAVSAGDQYRVMKESDCILTIPGTKCGEAGLLGTPMIVTLPTNRLEVIPYPGVPNILEKIPLAGRYLKRWLLAALLPRFGFVSQPNILAKEEIVPEIVANLTAELVADQLVALLRDDARRERMSAALTSLYRSLQPGAGRMISAILEETG